MPANIAWSLRRRRASFRRNLSQAGQDFWVAGEVFNGKRNGFFVDIGAADGYDISNTLLLETRYGWTGICVEANPDTYKVLIKARRTKCVNACVDRNIGTVTFLKDGLFSGITPANQDLHRATNDEVLLQTITLQELLEKHNAPRVIDYLSIDVEGAEERVLGEFDHSRFLFRAATIERPNRTLREALKNEGYLLIKEIPGLDCFYVHESFIKEYSANLMRFWNNT